VRLARRRAYPHARQAPFAIVLPEAAVAACREISQNQAQHQSQNPVQNQPQNGTPTATPAAPVQTRDPASAQTPLQTPPSQETPA
jgi:hypothetical protein